MPTIRQIDFPTLLSADLAQAIKPFWAWPHAKETGALKSIGLPNAKGNQG